MMGTVTHPDDKNLFPIVGIGASAGGLEAAQEMLGQVSPDARMAFVLVQHLDPNHESLMAELISRRSRLHVHQTKDGDIVEPGHVYVIPPGRRLTIKSGILRLDDFPQPRGLRRPIDDFLFSLAEDRKSAAAGVILSGTGADGSSGLRAIKEHGGLCIVQSPETARYDGMPTAALATGLVDFVLSPGEIASVTESFFRRLDAGSEDLPEAGFVQLHLPQLCAYVREAVGHDFSGYKPSTMVRRITRRMQVLGIGRSEEYLERIAVDEEECRLLFKDLLINVTSFFRDPEYFDVLKEKAIIPLLKRASAKSPVRIWIPGCSSGEEAYSIAMLCDAAARESDCPSHIQIFATDIDERMLEIARNGRYPITALSDIPEPYRIHYGSAVDAQFQISSLIRNMIRFSVHNIIQDPPFSQMDLISCRNLLIYMGDRIQTSLLPLLHYSLKPEGFLFLGPSEGVGRREELFSTVDQKTKLFQRRSGTASQPVHLPAEARARDVRFDAVSRLSPRQGGVRDLDAAATRLLERYAPPSVTVGESGEILSTRGILGKYLSHPQGGPAVTIYEVAHPGVRDVVAPLLRSAQESRRPVAYKDLVAVSEFGRQKFDLVADPLPDATVLLIFLEADRFQQELRDSYVEAPSDDTRAGELERELRDTRFRLQSTVEELETTNEELKSSNEEMMSMNEELQSANEELSTVNEELKSKIDELAISNADLQNFVESTELAVVVVDENLQIRTYTGFARKVFGIGANDHGRHFKDAAPNMPGDGLVEDVEKVVGGGAAVERLVTSEQGGRTYSVRILPYLSAGGKMSGATVVVAEITNLVKAEAELADQTERLRLALSAGGLGVWEYDPTTKKITLDDVQRKLLSLDRGGTLPIADALRHVVEGDRKSTLDELESAISSDSEFRSTIHVEAGGIRRWLKAVGKCVPSRGSARPRVLGVCFDLSAEQEGQEKLRLLTQELNHRVKNLFAVISGMMSLSARVAESPSALANEMIGRIGSLARAHDIAQQSSDPGQISLRRLIQTILDPYGESRFSVDGPDTLVPLRMVSPLSLIFHELATNSAKYGAFTVDSGRVDVEWSNIEAKDGRRVRIEWQETGGPELGSGGREVGEGFGSRLMRASAAQLGGTIKCEFHGKGLYAELSVPLG